MAGSAAVAIKHHTKMVNARVSSPTAVMAADILKRSGLTISDFIRGTLEHLVRTREVPSYLTEEPDMEAELKKIREFFDIIEKNTADLETPPELVGLTDKEILNLARDEKYGL